jgi:hypothetical protein
MGSPQERQAHTAAQDLPVARPDALAHFGAHTIYQEVEEEAGGIGGCGHCSKGCLHRTTAICPQQSCLHRDDQGSGHCIHSRYLRTFLCQECLILPYRNRITQHAMPWPRPRVGLLSIKHDRGGKSNAHQLHGSHHSGQLLGRLFHRWCQSPLQPWSLKAMNEASVASRRPHKFWAPVFAPDRIVSKCKLR